MAWGETELENVIWNLIFHSHDLNLWFCQLVKKSNPSAALRWTADWREDCFSSNKSERVPQYITSPYDNNSRYIICFYTTKEKHIKENINISLVFSINLIIFPLQFWRNDIEMIAYICIYRAPVTNGTQHIADDLWTKMKISIGWPHCPAILKHNFFLEKISSYTYH